MRSLLLFVLILSQSISFGQSTQNEVVVVNEKEKLCFKKTKNVSSLTLPISLKDGIVTGFKTGNSALLAKYFSTKIDISLFGKANLYSKSQAEQVLKTFFNEHKPSNFIINHEGQSANIKYYIGTLSTSNGTFRITINTKQNLISNLSIEK